MNVKCNKNVIEYIDENEQRHAPAFNVGKNCMVQLQKLCPFPRDDSLKVLFLEHQKVWTRDFINKWMKKYNLKWSDVKNMETVQWLNRDWNIEPYSNDVDLLGYWEFATRSEERKLQRPARRHIPGDISPLNATEELQKFVPEVKAEPTPRLTGLRSTMKRTEAYQNTTEA